MLLQPRPLVPGTRRLRAGALLAIDFTALADGALPAPLSGATWAVASGAAKNTPTESATKIANGDFETWSSATDAGSWTEGLAGTSTVNRDGTDQRSGTFCARLDVDASNSQVQVFQAPSGVSVGDFTRLVGYMKSNIAAKLAFLAQDNQRNSNNFYTLTTSYAEYALCSYVTTLAGYNIVLRRGGTNSFSQYMDDFTLNVLTKTTLYSTANLSVADVVTKANWTVLTGTLAGVIMNVDDISNPQNYVMLLVNGATNTYFLWKVVAGTLTQVATGVSSYVAGAAVELRKSGTTYQVFYNGVQKGTDQTISDAGIINNTIHGMVSMDYRNACSFFSVA